MIPEHKLESQEEVANILEGSPADMDSLAPVHTWKDATAVANMVRSLAQHLELRSLELHKLLV